MFLFIPQLLIVLSLAGIILIVLRRTPELRFPVPVLVKNLEGFLQKWTALGFEKLWLFVLEVKEISKKTKPLGFLPKSLPKLHLPGRPRLNMSSFTGPKPGTAELFIKQGEKSLAAGDHYHASLGQAFHNSKQYDKAIAAHERAIELDPNNPRGYLNLGMTLEAKKHLEEAILNYRKAVDLDGDNTHYVMILSEALAKKGDKDEAEILLEKILMVEPTNQHAREKLMSLKY